MLLQFPLSGQVRSRLRTRKNQTKLALLKCNVRWKYMEEDS